MKLLTAARNGDNGAFRKLYRECGKSIPYTSVYSKMKPSVDTLPRKEWPFSVSSA